jgi:hypothetical protein
LRAIHSSISYAGRPSCLTIFCEKLCENCRVVASGS